MSGIDVFMNTKFDEHARAYGEYFCKVLNDFEDKLEIIKREIK